MTELLQEGLNALSNASVYALVATGFSIIFGVSRIVNIAYGDLLSLGAYLAFVIAPNGAITYIFGFGVATLLIGLLCLVLERLLYRWTLERPVNGFLISLGLVLVIENVLAYVYAYFPIRVVPADAGSWNLAGVLFPADTLIVIGGTATILIALMIFLEHTRTGLAIRAVATDREAASLMGAPVTRLIALVFAIAGILAGAGGAFIALVQPPSPYLGAELMLKGFLVALIGGLGSVRGAVIGALVLAIVETSIVWGLAWLQVAAWLDPIEFIAVVMLLILRPQGLVGGALDTA